MSATISMKPTAKVFTATCLEAFTVIGAERIDRAAKVIRGVKIVGIKSRNPGRTIGIPSDEPYSYEPRALESAIPLYEGAEVHNKHPKIRTDASGRRHADDKTSGDPVGVLRNVHMGSDGLYGDLHYLESHPVTAQLLESIEGGMNLYKLSSNSITSAELRQGKPIVTQIAEVNSVDLITGLPGTTTTIFESGEPMDPEKKDEAVTTEMDGAPDAPAEEASGIDAAIKALQNAVLDDPNIDSAKAIKAIEGLLEKIKGMAPKSEAPATEADADGEEDDKEAKESAALVAHQNAVTTLESRKLNITSQRIAALAKAPADVHGELVQAWETADRASQRQKPPSGDRKAPATIDRKAEDFRAMAFSN